MTISRLLAALGVAGILVVGSSTLGGADEPTPQDKRSPQAEQVAPNADRAARLATYLSGAKFVG
ncbi:MAG: hypothetical protein ACF788_04675, partial [Novipirellula sp. JB048]